MNKFNTLKEVIEALDHIDRKAALYLLDNFDENDFQHGTGLYNGALRSDSRGPLDFFSWNNIHGVFAWYLLNSELMQSDIMNKINLKDYTTKDIDFTGCDPVIAKALKQNKSILCKVRDKGEFYVQQYNIVSYRKGKPYPYETTGNNVYKHAEPIKKRKTELRVKDPVSIMQYLIDNRYTIGVSGLYPEHPHDPVFLFEFFECCNLHPPENWQWSELLEEVAVKCEHEDSEPCDHF